MQHRFEWSDKNNIGIPALDEQHRYFFKIANDILDLAEQPEPHKEELLRKMSSLADYAFFHFDTEEEMLRELSPEKYQEHLEQHAKYRREIRAFLESVSSKNEGTRELADEIAQFASDYVTRHMLGAFNHHELILELRAKNDGKEGQ